MFENLTERLGKTLNDLRGRGRLSEENIKDALREVRMALLEADVAVSVVREFIAHVKDRALGQDVMKSLTPGQAFIKLVQEELVRTIGEPFQGLVMNVTPPAVILMAGLQGAGKTTTVAKLARWLKEREHKKVLVTSCDVYRPAAIDQLELLATEVGARFYRGEAVDDPVKIGKAAVESGRKQFMDVVIVDTAGRLHIDEQMMTEIKCIHSAIHPVETLFIVDSMTGQDAANTARAFNEALPLTGVVLTKVDGDARGGAALSVRQITGKPIKFLGIGEKTTALEPFHPERVASRILGMGDVLSLVEQAERNIDSEKARKLAKKVKKGRGFDLDDFKDQLQQLRKMGGVASLVDKLPGMPKGVDTLGSEKEMVRIEAMINSMTPHERTFPAVIKGSRKRRIALGSGTQVQDINRMLKQFTQMQKMMKQVSKGGMGKLMRAMKGKMPPGMPF